MAVSQSLLQRPSLWLGGWSLLCLLLASPAAGFHDGGSGRCASCHIMHESEDGLTVLASGELLRGQSASDVCLGCHAGSNGAVFGLNPLFPPTERGAGNFVFLLEDNLNDAPDGATSPIHGEAAGHSIVAPSMGVAAETRWPTAPGGTFPSSELGCTSCHDPHGNQNFRLLHGVGPVQGGIYSFTYGAPEGDGIPLDGPGESPILHTAYRRGWANWCSNCHGRYHDDGPTSFEHDFGHAFGGRYATNYGLYDGDANPAGGTPSVSYLPEVPFQSVTATINSTGAPQPSSRVICTSCHRAHASSAPAAARWDFGVEFLSQDGAVSGSYAIPNPYPDPQQGQLCSKCHTDEGFDSN